MRSIIHFPQPCLWTWIQPHCTMPSWQELGHPTVSSWQCESRHKQRRRICLRGKQDVKSYQMPALINLEYPRGDMLVLLAVSAGRARSDVLDRYFQVPHTLKRGGPRSLSHVHESRSPGKIRHVRHLSFLHFKGSRLLVNKWEL